jgi:hypothetical protein
MTCRYAAWNGHLHILKWARENGCPWREQQIVGMVRDRYPEILEWVEQIID